MNHLDPDRVLGELGKFTREERDDFYKNRICVPTDTDAAGNLERVQYAQLYVSLEQPKSLLDVGCHDAFVSRNLAKNNDCIDVVTCVDPCHAALNEAEEALHGQPFAGKFDIWEMTWEEFARRSRALGYPETLKHDMVICFETIEHFESQESSALLQFLWSCVNQGGRLLLSTPDETGHWGSRNNEREHLQLFTPETLVAHVKDAIGVDLDWTIESGLILATAKKD